MAIFIDGMMGPAGREGNPRDPLDIGARII